MRRIVLAAALVSLVALEAVAGSTLVYNSQGKLDHVIRASPSGFVIYDNHGHVLSAVRQFGFGQWSAIDRQRSTIRIIGTGLRDEASTLQGGVGFE